MEALKAVREQRLSYIVKMKPVGFPFSYSGWHLYFVRIHITTLVITFIFQLLDS